MILLNGIKLETKYGYWHSDNFTSIKKTKKLELKTKMFWEKVKATTEKEKIIR